MSDPVRSHRRQPTRLCRPWDSPGKNTGVGCHFLLHNSVLAVQISHKQSSLCMCRPSVFRLACLNFWLVPKVIKFTFVFVDLLMQKLTRVSVLAQFLFLSCCSWTDLGQTFLSGLIHFPHLPTSQTHAHTLVSLEQVLSRPPRPGSP